METVEIGHSAVTGASIIATLLLVFGWAGVPTKYKQLIIAAGLMFVGYSILEFVLTSFITIKV